MIVVGIDGSAASVAALRWAVDEAARRAQRVLAVMAHLPPGQVMIGAVPYDALPPSGMAAMHEEIVHRLASVVSEVDAAGVTIDQMVVSGRPGEELVKLSATADLLVLGGHGAKWPEFVVGSVSSYCVRHANCPVVVMPRHVAETTGRGVRDGGAGAAPS